MTFKLRILHLLKFKDFNEAGAFSGTLTITSVRTTATTEWADVFADLGIDSITGYDQATGLVAQNYATGTIYQDFSAVTAGSNWHDITFTDSNGNGKIDCADASSCELADMATRSHICSKYNYQALIM